MPDCCFFWTVIFLDYGSVTRYDCGFTGLWRCRTVVLPDIKRNRIQCRPNPCTLIITSKFHQRLNNSAVFIMLVGWLARWFEWYRTVFAASSRGWMIHYKICIVYEECALFVTVSLTCSCSAWRRLVGISDNACQVFAAVTCAITRDRCPEFLPWPSLIPALLLQHIKRCLIMIKR